MANVVKVARCPEHGLHGQRETCFDCGGPVEQVEMVPFEEVLGGDIAGPGGPHDKGAVIFHTAGAMILDYSTFAMMDAEGVGQEGVAILLEGRINQTQHRGKVLVLTSDDGLAALVTEGMALMGRAGGERRAKAFVDLVTGRLEELEAEGALTKPEDPDGN